MFSKSEDFILGVNYWPRRHGVKMWQRFDIEEIDCEFAQIRKMGMNVVRVFPLWNDFQPLVDLPWCFGVVREQGMRMSGSIYSERWEIDGIVKG